MVSLRAIAGTAIGLAILAGTAVGVDLGRTGAVKGVGRGLTTKVEQSETVIAPGAPSGPSSGSPGTSYAYTTGGAVSSSGHAVEYRFDWGGGSYSSWSSSSSASHSWSTAGTYSVKAQARCVTHTDVVSGWSSALAVGIFSTFSISGKVCTDIVALVPVSGVSVAVYELDATALRVGGPVYSTTTPADGSWGVFNAKAGTYYEIEMTKTGFDSIYHDFMPPAVANRSDANLEYFEAISPPTYPGGWLVVSRDTSAKKILGTDTIQIDGGANVNNATVSDGTHYLLRIYQSGSGDGPGSRDLNVTAAASPGQAHSVAYQGVIRAVRVFPYASYHLSVAVFY